MATARRLAQRALLTTARAANEFVADRGHRDAAQIAFFAVLSFAPLAILLVGAFGLFFDDGEVRRRVVDTVFDNVPLAAERDRAQVQGAVDSALNGSGRLGLLSVLVLAFAASGVMAALRHAINQAWDIPGRPPLLRRKALDLALVLSAALILLLSLAVTGTRRAQQVLGREGEYGWLASIVLEVVGDALPLLFVFGTVLFLFRVLPMERPRLREIWPGALVATALLALVKGALELYFEQLADFGAIYGSLGALMALLVFVYAGSNAVVFGAEFASEWSRLPADEEVARRVAGGRRRLRERLPLR